MNKVNVFLPLHSFLQTFCGLCSDYVDVSHQSNEGWNFFHAFCAYQYQSTVILLWQYCGVECTQYKNQIHNNSKKGHLQEVLLHRSCTKILTTCQATTLYVNARKHGTNQTRLRFCYDLTFEIKQFTTMFDLFRKLKLGMYYPRIFKIRMIVLLVLTESSMASKSFQKPQMIVKQPPRSSKARYLFRQRREDMQLNVAPSCVKRIFQVTAYNFIYFSCIVTSTVNFLLIFLF